MQKIQYHPFLRRSSIPKIKNYLRLKSEYRNKVSVLTSYPYIAIIDPTNICNLQCPGCPTGQNRHTSQGLMNVETFKKIINELGPYLYEVWLYNWGEPFINNNIFDMIAIAEKANISTTISTNLNHFPDGYAKQLVDARLERLVVSFDGFTQNSYSAYRKGGDLNKVKNNISQIMAEKKRQKSILPLIKLQFLVNRFNEHEIQEAKSYANALGIDIEFKNFMYNAKNPVLRNKWQSTLKQYQHYNEAGNDVNLQKYLCSWLWLFTVINWNGTINPCCNWFERGKFMFGDLKAQSFKDIWNNELFVSARKKIAGNESTPVTACHSCLGVPPVFDGTIIETSR